MPSNFALLTHHTTKSKGKQASKQSIIMFKTFLEILGIVIIWFWEKSTSIENNVITTKMVKVLP
jgi:hypothetical protein